MVLMVRVSFYIRGRLFIFSVVEEREVYCIFTSEVKSFCIAGTIGDETKISRRKPGPLSPLPSHLFPFSPVTGWH
jgi:hypothetical protein